LHARVAVEDAARPRVSCGSLCGDGIRWLEQ
jgi:hypothetical protein